MDRKTLGIIVLTITATLLAGVIVQGLREPVAYGQAAPGAGGDLSYRYSDYVMVPLAVAQDVEILCLVDTVTQRMLFFEYDINTKQLAVYGKGVEVSQDLK
jgi:hypothetical protein